MKLSIIFLLGASLAESAFGFSASSSDAKKISWPEYKHDFIDPIPSQHDDSHLEGHMDPTKRQVSDQYWMEQFAEDKEKLHKLNVALKEDEEAQKMASPATSYDSYKMNYIDPIKKSKSFKSDLKGHMDPSKRAEADEFWLKTVLEEKEKLHGKKSP